MTLSVQPILKTSYTERGNEYKESNIGKYAAGASAAAATAVYGGEYAFKGAKKIYNKAKVVKMDLSGILKPQTKRKVTVQFGEKGASIIVNTKKVNKATKFISENAKKINKENIKKVGQFIVNTAKKVNMENIKKAGKSVIDFVKTNAKKINKENIQKASEAGKKVFKQPAVKYGASVLAGLAGIVAVGYLADAIANKISAHKADKV